MTIKERNYPFDIGLSKLILRKGLKQNYVAKKAGYTSQELNDMLNGRRLIKVCDIPMLAKALDVRLDDIYEAGKESEKDGCKAT